MQTKGFTLNECIPFKSGQGIYPVEDVIGPLPVGAVVLAGTVIGNANTTLGNEVRTLNINGSPTGGTVSIAWAGYQSSTPQPVPYNANATQVQAALQNIFPAGSVTVTGPTSGAFTCTFGGPLANRQIGGTFTIAAALTGGTSPTANMVQTTKGSAGTGQLGVYASGNTDGTAVATCVLKRDYLGGASGGSVNEWGDLDGPTSPVVYLGGCFRIGGGAADGRGGAALVGWDATAHSTLLARFRSGTSDTDPNAVVIF